MGTWDLETRGEGREDIKHGKRGRMRRRCGDVKYRDAGEVGTLKFIAKVQGKCDTSFFTTHPSPLMVPLLQQGDWIKISDGPARSPCVILL